MRQIFSIAKGIIYVLLTFNFITLQTFNSFSQGGAAINTSGAAAVSSAMLDVSSTNQGMRIPRVALTSITSASPVTNPVNSLLVYDSATVSGVNGVSPGYYYWDTTSTPDKWVKLLADVSGSNGWLTNGNAGTDSTVNFIGTTDSKPLVIKTGGAEKMRIMANGKVGIGTTNPGAKFDVSNGNAQIGGTLRITGFDQPVFSSGVGLEIRYFGGEGNILGYNRGTSTVIPIGFSASSFHFDIGNVGIGTTSPGSKLEINKATDGNWTNPFQAYIPDIASGDGMNLKFGKDAGKNAWIGYRYSSTPANSYLMMGHQGLNEQFVLTYGGNVGIGTTSPNNVLDIVKTVTVNNPTTMRSLRFGVDSNPNYSFYIGTGGLPSMSGVLQVLDNGNPSNIVFNPSGGNVGIGTTSPAQKLDVSGDYAIDGSRIFSGYYSGTISVQYSNGVWFNVFDSGIVGTGTFLVEVGPVNSCDHGGNLYSEVAVFLVHVFQGTNSTDATAIPSTFGGLAPNSKTMSFQLLRTAYVTDGKSYVQMKVNESPTSAMNINWQAIKLF
ncbi:MAG: hypothetical protein HGB12_09635 [Bacteroidetes bacterium]|nr:hypothetical protein [Bacteroidota bacterium]